MPTIRYGLRNYQNHEIANKSQSPHPLDILSSILFDIKNEGQRREAMDRKNGPNSKPDQGEFCEILKKEMSK